MIYLAVESGVKWNASVVQFQIFVIAGISLVVRTSITVRDALHFLINIFYKVHIEHPFLQFVDFCSTSARLY